MNSQTGTIRIVGAFPNPGNVLRPGQFGRIRAMTSLNRSALLVPQRAVTELQGRYQVAVVDANNQSDDSRRESGRSRGRDVDHQQRAEAGDAWSPKASKVRDGDGGESAARQHAAQHPAGAK